MGTIRPPARGQPRLGRFIEQQLHTLMILPAALALLLIIAFPLAYSLWMAVHEYSMGATTPPLFVGAANYLELLRNQRFQETVPRTFYFTLLGVAGPVLIGTLAALAFTRTFPGRGILRTIFTLPMMATPVSIALIWQMMFHPSWACSITC